MPQGGEESQDRRHFPFLARLEVLPEWEAAAGRFLELGGAVMVLGAPDTGKSTLCRYLVYRAFAAGHTVALVDLDLGQSHLGPPTTLGLGFFPPRRPGDGSLNPEGLYFIGQTSPVGAILEVAVGCRILCDQARAAGITRVVVNTSGLVQRLGALKLKRSQVELLDPALILALQRGEELEPLLRGLGAWERGQATSPLLETNGGLGSVGAGSPRPETSSSGTPSPLGGKGWGEGEKLSNLIESTPSWPIMRLPVSSRVVRRSPEERRSYREERFRRYFRPARRLDLPWGPLVWDGLPLGLGRPLGPEELARLSRSLEVAVLHGESQGSRALLLLAEPPSGPLDQPLGLGAAWDRMHWLSWSSLHFRLVGLLDGRRRTLALALILPATWHPQSLALWTPLAPEAAGQVRFLKVGKIRVNLEGRELSYV
ncbi:MAG: Clp1/GlmU family protein [Pseudomonadota bacterium]